MSNRPAIALTVAAAAAATVAVTSAVAVEAAAAAAAHPACRQLPLTAAGSLIAAGHVQELTAALKVAPPEVAGRVVAMQKDVFQKEKEIAALKSEVAVAKALALSSEVHPRLSVGCACLLCGFLSRERCCGWRQRAQKGRRCAFQAAWWCQVARQRAMALVSHASAPCCRSWAMFVSHARAPFVGTPLSRGSVPPARRV